MDPGPQSLTAGSLAATATGQGLGHSCAERLLGTQGGIPGCPPPPLPLWTRVAKEKARQKRIAERQATMAGSRRRGPRGAQLAQEGGRGRGGGAGKEEEPCHHCRAPPRAGTRKARPREGARRGRGALDCGRLWAPRLGPGRKREEGGDGGGGRGETAVSGAGPKSGRVTGRGRG